MRAGSLGAMIVLGATVAIGLGLLQRWALRRRSAPDAEIARLIREKGARLRFAGFDPALRERSAKQRKRADRIKAQASRIASTPAAAPRRKPAGNVQPLRRRA